MLCQICEALRCSLDLSNSQELDFHDSINNLQLSSESGCHLCRIVYTDFCNQFQNELVPRNSRQLIKTVENQGFILSFIHKSKEDSPVKPVQLNVKVRLDRLKVPKKLNDVIEKTKNLDDSHTGSDTSFKIAFSWLEECRENHAHCGGAQVANTLLPTRVINVGSVNASTEQYLLETGGVMKGSYTTLSHCWGNSSPIKTTVQNIHLHKSEIKIDRLPRTFRDAVQVTRELGIQFLWIDSLCIVQDDERDWERESGFMGRYYSNSLITIAAAHGENSEAGLFKERDSLSTRPCELEVYTTGQTGRSLQKVYAYAMDTSFQISKSSLSQAYKPLPLYSRAWVLQEQLLSLRTLTYSNSGISWRCQTMRFDERAPLAMSIEDFLNDRPQNLVSMMGDPREVESMISEFQRNWIFPKQSNSSQREGKQQTEFFHRRDCYHDKCDHFTHDWARVIEDYTSRGMTYQSDKLVAIRGISDVAAKLRSERYTAGIWNGSERTFVQGLLWHSSRPGNRILEVAPSWSWASVEGEVRWLAPFQINFQLSVEILDFKYSETVAKSEGIITLRSNTRVGVIDKDGKVQIAKWPQEIPDELFAADLNKILSIESTTHWEQVVISMDEKLEADTMVYFLELAIGQISVMRTEWSVNSLVLTKDTMKKGQFRRVGLSTWNQDFWRTPQLPARVSSAEIVASSIFDKATKEIDEHGYLEIRSMEFIIA